MDPSVPPPTAEPMSRLRRAALVLAGAAFLLPFAVGTLVELALKSVNPAGVDVAQPLAYLRELLVSGGALALIMLVLTVAVIVRLQRTEGRGAARPAWVVLVTQGVLVVVILVENGLVDAVERASTGG